MKTQITSDSVTILLAVLAILLLAAIPITMAFVPPPPVIVMPMSNGQGAAQNNGGQNGDVQAVAAQLPKAKTVEFTLKTQLGGNPAMAFVGVGGEIDGKVNPPLQVNFGDTVRLTVINGAPVLHDFTIDAFNVHSGQLTKQDQQVTMEFVANRVGTFEYYCSVPGHKDIGMKGTLHVAGLAAASGAAASAATTQTAQTAAPIATAQAGMQAEHQAAMQPGMQMVDMQVAVPTAAPAASDAVSIVRNPADVPPPVGNRAPQHVRFDLTAKEVDGILANADPNANNGPTTYRFMTFDGKVPGPLLRVRVSDTVEIHLHNDPSSQLPHSIDLHAVTGPGGGAVYAQTLPGNESTFTFQALQPGLYVYHCATPSIGHHISSGMYGLILVEPEGGLPKVDHEFYFMEGELYTVQPFGTPGHLDFSHDKMLAEQPEYYTFNGAAGALTQDANAMHAKVGETVRVFFGVGGPNATSSFHLIGEIFDRVYDQASLTSAPLKDVQTTTVAPGGATMVEFKLEVPGRYFFVDHALSRIERGLGAFLYVDGPDNPAIFHGEGKPNTGGH